jgi:hypothetical protein
MKFASLLSIVIWGGILLAPQVCDAQAKPDKRLAQKITVDFRDKSLGEALREACEKCKLPIDIHTDVEMMIKGYPVTLVANGISLESALQILFEGQDAYWSVEKGRLVVTEGVDKLETREYSLAGLGGNIAPQVLVGHLLELTTGFWKDADQDGGEITAVSEQSITIRQTRRTHAEIQTFFDELSALAGGRPKATPQDKAEQLLLKKLQTPVQLAGGELEVSDIVDQLLKKNGISYSVDLSEISAGSIDWGKLKSTVDPKKISIAKRLDAIAAEHKLAWRVVSEVVQITSAENLDRDTILRVYDVRKMVSPDNPIEAVAAQLVANKNVGDWQGDEGVRGAVMPFGTSLLVYHTGSAHAKIAKILK